MMAGSSYEFATTRWSLVASAGRRTSAEAEEALAFLCQRYWKPLYAYARRHVSNNEEARDLTQGFFARLLEKNTFALAEPGRGRFRAFLLTALKHFLLNERDKAAAQKQGGGRPILSLDFDKADSTLRFEPADERTPEKLFDRQWALTVLEQVMNQLEAEYREQKKTALFEHLKSFLIEKTASHAAAAATLGMTEGAVRAAAHRLRKRYRELLREEVARTVETEDEVEDELRQLLLSLQS
ncbi:MAG: sigma-70 family RNA polymerase sigma factor [Gemmataceae bacterium]|nr:sigma-70 family RNA polymerase sigma factor [Gemmataceae bacterium]MCI0742541.1 sigma-70 family RNA polymerase sigma factor [Gemmataceae bacterium]